MAGRAKRLWDVLARSVGQGVTTLPPFILPASEARRTTADLDATGVNYAQIFFDVEGVARLAVFRTALKYGITLTE